MRGKLGHVPQHNKNDKLESFCESNQSVGSILSYMYYERIYL